MKFFEMGLLCIVNPYDKVHLSELYNQFGILKDINNIRTVIDELNISEPYKVMLSFLRKLQESDAAFFEEALIQFREYAEDSSILSDENELIKADIENFLELWSYFKSDRMWSNKSMSGFVHALKLGLRYSPHKKAVTLALPQNIKEWEYDVVLITGAHKGEFPLFKENTDAE